MGTDEAGQEDSGPARRPRLHWHIMLTHFPISAFLGAFMFMALHLITGNACFSLSAYVSLFAGALVMVPTGLTGWAEWKKRYRAYRSRAFVAKIWVGVGMTLLGAGLVLFHSVFHLTATDIPHSIYFTGLALLMVGAVLEGHWGSRLHHR